MHILLLESIELGVNNTFWCRREMKRGSRLEPFRGDTWEPGVGITTEHRYVLARTHRATLLDFTKKSFCLCNFIRLRLFPMVYFSVCSQPIEVSQGGKPTRLHYLPTLWLWNLANLLCVALFCRLLQIKTISCKAHQLTRRDLVADGCLDKCLYKYLYVADSLELRCCNVQSCQVSRTCGGKASPWSEAYFRSALPPWNLVSLRLHVIQHTLWRKKHNISPCHHSLVK